MKKNLLLGSGGTNKIPERVNAWKKAVLASTQEGDTHVFIPYALADYDTYTEKMNLYHNDLPKPLQGIHTFDSIKTAIEKASSIYIGGGNTFRLLYRLQEHDLMNLIREKILSGTPYIGISAGTNVACPTICNTNDMPIMCPPKGFNALNLIQFQINAHYTEGKFYYGPSQDQLLPYGGESRDDRLREYHEENSTPVLALSEGSILKVDDDQYKLLDVGYAKLLRQGQEAQRFKAGQKIGINA